MGRESGRLAFFTPSALPLVWAALASSGAAFDVPDFWDGTIDSTFGFLSPVTVDLVAWNEGTLISSAPATPGWGASVGVSGLLDTSRNQTFTELIPINTSSFLTEQADTVTVTLVPEPSTALLLAFGLMAMAVGRRRWTN